MSLTVYRSSAGSGKTFTLVIEYLKLVLKFKDNYRHILALTFTNKAANEMKDRVLKYLDLLSDENPADEAGRRSDIMNILTAETGLNPDEITKRSKEVLLNILHNFSDFSVSTIDSFNHRVVRTFAYDLFLSSDFEVELDQEILINQAVDELLSSIGLRDDITKALVNYSLGQSEQDKSWNIEKGLKDISALLFKEDGRLMVAELGKLSLEDFGRINSKLNEWLKVFDVKVRKTGEEAVKLIESNNLSFNDFTQKKSGVGKYFYSLRDEGAKSLEPNSHVIKALTEDKWIPGNTSGAIVKAFESIKQQLHDLLLKAVSLFEKEKGRLILYNAVQVNLNQLSVLSELDKILSKLTREQNLVHISEFNRRIAEIVRREPTPFIYSRLGDKYTSFLVDEFQDTSLLQWQNLLPLIDNSLSEDHFNLIVGDGKQAIYRWRNGEVEQFSSLPRIFKKPSEHQFTDYENALSRSFVEKNLSFNYRTRKNIVDFNNQFFEMASACLPEPLKKIYLNHYQSVPSGQEGGYIRVDIYDKKARGDKTFGDFNADLLITYINECLADGYSLSDIAILTRVNKHNMEAASVLLQNNIPLQSSESVQLEKQIVVKFLIACLKHLSNPHDDISMAVIRRYIKENNLPESHWKDFNIHDLPGLSLFELCERIAGYFQFPPATIPYQLRFFDIVRDFSEKQQGSIAVFLEWWEENRGKQFIESPPVLDAVKIMTVHKAKGLEFPVVMLPYASLSLPTRNNFWVYLEENIIPGLKVALLNMNKSLDDTAVSLQYNVELARCTLDLLNIIYVAFTRPVDRLYVVTSKPPESSKSDNMTLPRLLSSYFAAYPDGMKESFYETGEKTNKSCSSKDLSANELVLNELYSIDWRSRLIIKENAPENWTNGNNDDIRKAGIIIHDLLAGLKSRSELDKLLKSIDTAGLPGSVNKQNITDTVNQVINHPVIGKYYDDGLEVFNECAILSPNGSVSRPDRAVLINGELVIIDYKTGKASLNHEKQVRYYLQTAREMGYKANKAFLVYLGEKLIVNEIV